MEEDQKVGIRLCNVFVQSSSVLNIIYLQGILPGWEQGSPGAPEEGQVSERGHLIYNFCLEILLQMEMSLQMQEHSVPMQV